MTNVAVRLTLEIILACLLMTLLWHVLECENMCGLGGGFDSGRIGAAT